MGNLGENLKKILKAKGLGQKAFAEQAKVSVETVNTACNSEIWTGHSSKLKSMADALGLTVDELTGGTGEYDPNVINTLDDFCRALGIDPARAGSAALLAFTTMTPAQREEAILKLSEFQKIHGAAVIAGRILIARPQGPPPQAVQRGSVKFTGSRGKTMPVSEAKDMPKAAKPHPDKK